MLNKAMFLAMFAVCVACGDGQFEMKPTVQVNPNSNPGVDGFEQQPAADASNPYATNVANEVQPYSPSTNSSNVGGSTTPAASSNFGNGQILSSIFGNIGKNTSTSNSYVGGSANPSSYSPSYSYAPTYSSPPINKAPVVPVKSTYIDSTKSNSSSAYSPTYSSPSSSYSSPTYSSPTYSSPSSSSSTPVTAATYKGVNDYTPSYGYGTVPSYGSNYGGYSACGC